MLKYGRNEKNDVLRFYRSRTANAILVYHIFIRRFPPSNLVVVTFLLTSLRKGFFLRRRLKRYRFFMTKLQF